MSPQSQNLGQSLSESIGESGAIDVASDVAEMALDATLEDGLLRDVPVFGWFVKAYGTVHTVRDRILLKKIAGFLNGVHGTANNADIQSFRLKVQNDMAYSSEVGENLVLLIDRHENYEKAPMLGRVFARHLTGDLTTEEFRRLARAIDICGANDLAEISHYYDRIKEYKRISKAPGESPGLFENFLPSIVTHQLFSAGLVDQDGWVETTYKENAVGMKLIECLG